METFTNEMGGEPFMIVKLILHKQMDAISIWNKDGDRLYYSDKAKDIEIAKDLLKIIKAKTDKDLAHEMKSGEKLEPVYEQKMSGYFNAYWKNKIVQLKKRAEGYSW